MKNMQKQPYMTSSAAKVLRHISTKWVLPTEISKKTGISVSSCQLMMTQMAMVKLLEENTEKSNEFRRCG